jgi:hypothetical protein
MRIHRTWKAISCDFKWIWTTTVPFWTKLIRQIGSTVYVISIFIPFLLLIFHAPVIRCTLARWLCMHTRQNIGYYYSTCNGNWTCKICGAVFTFSFFQVSKWTEWNGMKCSSINHHVWKWKPRLRMNKQGSKLQLRGILVGYHARNVWYSTRIIQNLRKS